MGLRRSLMAMVAGGGGGIPSANLAALLHMNGADGSTTFTDESGKTWTAFGQAQIDTASSQWGGAAGTFDGSGDYITTDTHADFGFGGGDFTLAGWMQRPIAGGTPDRCLFDNRSASNEGIAIYTGGGSSPNRLRAFNNSALIAQSASDLPNGSWIHWAVARQGTTLRGFLAGAVAFSATDSRTYASTAKPYIGANYIGTQGYLGNADDILVLKGLALYTAAFTPPAGPYVIG